MLKESTGDSKDPHFRSFITRQMVKTLMSGSLFVTLFPFQKIRIIALPYLTGLS